LAFELWNIMVAEIIETPNIVPSTSSGTSYSIRKFTDFIKNMK
jgi:hypothetical protein